MTLDEFVEQERNRLEAFRLAWLKANSTHPNSFPLKMPEGDEGLWDESLSDFDGKISTWRELTTRRTPASRKP